MNRVSLFEKKYEKMKNWDKYVSDFIHFLNLNFFGRHIVCLHRHFVCLHCHLDILKFLEIHEQKRFCVFLKSQISTTRFLSLLTLIYLCPPPPLEHFLRISQKALLFYHIRPPSPVEFLCMPLGTKRLPLA